MRHEPKIQVNSFMKPKSIIFGLVFGLLFSMIAQVYMGMQSSVQAVAGINQQVNFQARLLNAQGATVPDGNYNIQFKIYRDGDGDKNTADETLLWTEEWLNQAGNGVVVKNGYLSVYLGKINTALGSVDFNQDTMWLSLNVGNTNGSCTPFTGCGGDGEMNPYKRFASSPYAMNAGKLSGLTSNQFVQLSQGVQADSSTASSIFLNKTGASGNIIQLQKAAGDVFIVGNAGNTSINTNSTAALIVQNGNNAFGVDTTNTKVAIGLATTLATSRFSIAGQAAANGITLGDGAAGSANLYVSANDTLKSDDALIITGLLTGQAGLTVAGGGASITGNSTIAGTLGSITNLSLSGSISGGTTYSGSGNITSTGGSVIAATHTGSAAVAVSSGGSSALTVTSASGTVLLGGSTNTVQRTNASLSLDVVNAAAVSTLNVINSDATQLANLDVEGGLNIGASQTYKIGNTDINTAGTLTNVAYENQANTFTAAQALQKTSAAAFLIQSDTGATTLLTADTSAMIIKIGTTSSGSLSGVDLVVAEAEVAATLRIGNATNGAEFSTTGVLYRGTGRPSKAIIFNPEYEGAVLSTDGSAATTGTLTSDNGGSADSWRSYYDWTSLIATNQDYTIIIRVTLPLDWDGWETGACPGATCALEVFYKTGLAATTNNGVTLNVNSATDTPGTALCTIAEAASTAWTSSGCTSAQLITGAAPEWDAAGETAVIRVKLKANSTASAFARAGEIVLRYKAKF